MSRTVSLVQRIEVASPCHNPWEEMVGDERVRFCKSCRLNVYNLSAMTSEEAESLVREKEGRLCARFFRREDGTVLTRDCPVGLAAVRRGAVRIVAFAAGAAALALSTAVWGMNVVARSRGVPPWRQEHVSAYWRTKSAVWSWLHGAPPTAQVTTGVVIFTPPPLVAGSPSPIQSPQPAQPPVAPGDEAKR